MPMEEALVERLVNLATAASDRVSWFSRARGDEPPMIVLSKISPGEEWTHDGPDGLPQPRVQIDSYAATDVGAIALSRAIKAEMQQSAEVGDVRFHPAELDGENGFDEGEQDGGESLFRVQQDYLFFCEEI